MKKREKALAAAGGGAQAAPVEIDSDDEADAAEDDAAMSDTDVAASIPAAATTAASSPAHAATASPASAAASPAAAAAVPSSPPMFAVDTTPAPDRAEAKKAKAAALKAKNKENKKKGAEGLREKEAAEAEAAAEKLAQEQAAEKAAAQAAAVAEGRLSAEGVKLRPNGRVRTKKRSKQKNLKKDTRPEHLKPKVAEGADASAASTAPSRPGSSKKGPPPAPSHHAVTKPVGAPLPPGASRRPLTTKFVRSGKQQLGSDSTEPTTNGATAPAAGAKADVATAPAAKKAKLQHAPKQ